MARCNWEQSRRRQLVARRGPGPVGPWCWSVLDERDVQVRCKQTIPTKTQAELRQEFYDRQRRD